MRSNNSKPSLSPIKGQEDVEIKKIYVIRRGLGSAPLKKGVLAHSALLLELANGRYWEVGRAGWLSTKPQNYEADTVFREVTPEVLQKHETKFFEKISLGDGHKWTKQLHGVAPPESRTLGDAYNYSISHCRKKNYSISQNTCHEFQESIRKSLGCHVPPQTGQAWQPWFLRTDIQPDRPSWDDTYMPSWNAWRHGEFENEAGAEFSYGRTNRWAGVLFSTPGSPFDLAGEVRDQPHFASLLGDHICNEFRWKPQFFLREILAFENFVDVRSNYQTPELMRHATINPSYGPGMDPVGSFFLYQDLPNLTVPLSEIQAAATLQQRIERGLERERRPYVQTASEVRDGRYDSHFYHFQFHGPRVAEDLHNTYEHGTRTGDSSYFLGNLFGLAVWAGSAYLSGGRVAVRPSFRPESIGIEASWSGFSF